VGELERARFKVVLLDEYQDTSVAQATMLARLFSGPDRDHGLGHPVMAVGDPNQAIYGWRGASVSNILNFADTFPAADGAPGRLPLTVNRRSDRRILDVANRLAEPLLAAYGDKVARLRAADGARDGHVEAHVFERAADELAWLVSEVQQVHDAGTAWADIGVLSRDNAQGEEVYDALTAAERQVADRVAHGLTSRQIAEELFVSPRTVDAHLTHIYRKLDINTRARLAALVVDNR
jgi:DNA helicase-2/ATP-dependent DNA helicase PcrA